MNAKHSFATVRSHSCIPQGMQSFVGDGPVRPAFFASRRDATFYALVASLRDAITIWYGSSCYRALHLSEMQECDLRSQNLTASIYACPTTVILHVLGRKFASCVFATARSHSCIPKGMQSSVAKRTPPNLLFASQRDATKIRFYIKWNCYNNEMPSFRKNDLEIRKSGIFWVDSVSR